MKQTIICHHLNELLLWEDQDFHHMLKASQACSLLLLWEDQDFHRMLKASQVCSRLYIITFSLENSNANLLDIWFTRPTFFFVLIFSCPFEMMIYLLLCINGYACTYVLITIFEGKSLSG